MSYDEYKEENTNTSAFDLSSLESALASERLKGKIEGLEEAAEKFVPMHKNDTRMVWQIRDELRRMPMS